MLAKDSNMSFFADSRHLPSRIECTHVLYFACLVSVMIYGIGALVIMLVVQVEACIV